MSPNNGKTLGYKNIIRDGKKTQRKSKYKNNKKLNLFYKDISKSHSRIESINNRKISLSKRSSMIPDFFNYFIKNSNIFRIINTHFITQYPLTGVRSITGFKNWRPLNSNSIPTTDSAILIMVLGESSWIDSSTFQWINNGIKITNAMSTYNALNTECLIF